MINRIIWKVLFLSALLVQPLCLAYGQTAKSVGGQSISQASDIETLKSEVKRLMAENIKLKEENQQLRKMLASQDLFEPGPLPSVSRQQEKPSSGQLQNQTKSESSITSTDQQETGYWLTISSNKRHNKNCRYYKNSRGRFCKPDEGIPCKICGG